MTESAAPIPPRHGEGDHSAKSNGGGVPPILMAPIKQTKHARRLRQEMSLPEVLLWQTLRKRPDGLKFRRQFPQSGYYLDFACLEVRLAIEVDGEAHNRGNRPERDERRDEALLSVGFRTLRIPAPGILRDLDAVLTHIVTTARAVGPLHPRSATGGPPPRAGEELGNENPPRNGEVAVRRTDGGGPSALPTKDGAGK